MYKVFEKYCTISYFSKPEGHCQSVKRYNRHLQHEVFLHWWGCVIIIFFKKNQVFLRLTILFIFRNNQILTKIVTFCWRYVTIKVILLSRLLLIFPMSSLIYTFCIKKKLYNIFWNTYATVFIDHTFERTYKILLRTVKIATPQHSAEFSIMSYNFPLTV